MADVVTDLDALVAPRKKVALGGTIYEVPGDLPLEVFLKLNLASQKEDEDEGEALNILVDAIVDLFTWEATNSADLRPTVEPVIRRLGIRTISQIIGTIYKAEEDDADLSEAEAVPTQQETSTTSSSGNAESPTPTSTTESPAPAS